MTTPLDHADAEQKEPGTADGGARLRDLLAPALVDEPPLTGAISEVYRRSDRLARRRSRAVAAAGLAVAGLVTAIGYALTTVLLPTAPAHVVATAAPAAPDPIRTLLASMLRASHFTVVPREPARGDGWRRYLVLNQAGRPHGLIEVSAYAAPDGLCFPVLSTRRACARPMRAGDNVEYVRYTFDRDVDWQVNQVIARRRSDGRTIVVQATGERGTGTAAGGRPPLSALVAARIAADPRIAAGFGAQENCNGPDPACPVLSVAVTTA
jgi:hypothetical protein